MSSTYGRNANCGMMAADAGPVLRDASIHLTALRRAFNDAFWPTDARPCLTGNVIAWIPLVDAVQPATLIIPQIAVI